MVRGGPGGVSGTTIILHSGLHSVCQHLILSEVDEGVGLGRGISFLFADTTAHYLQPPGPKGKKSWDGVCPWLTGAKRGDSHSAFLFHLGICHGEMMVNVFTQTGTWLCFTCWVPPLPYTMPVLTPPESLGLQGDPTSPF